MTYTLTDYIRYLMTVDFIPLRSSISNINLLLSTETTVSFIIIFNRVRSSRVEVLVLFAFRYQTNYFKELLMT